MIVSTIASATAGQGPTGSFVVIVSVTLPELISALPGLYVALSNVVSLNEPSPPELHTELVALPPMDPDKV